MSDAAQVTEPATCPDACAIVERIGYEESDGRVTATLCFPHGCPRNLTVDVVWDRIPVQVVRTDDPMLPSDMALVDLLQQLRRMAYDETHSIDTTSEYPADTSFARYVQSRIDTVLADIARLKDGSQRPETYVSAKPVADESNGGIPGFPEA